jgi:hypothetical protein
VPCESINLLGIFTMLEFFLGGGVSFDLHNMPTTFKMQNIVVCETNKKYN